MSSHQPPPFTSARPLSYPCRRHNRNLTLRLPVCPSSRAATHHPDFRPHPYICGSVQPRSVCHSACVSATSWYGLSYKDCRREHTRRRGLTAGSASPDTVFMSFNLRHPKSRESSRAGRDEYVGSIVRNERAFRLARTSLCSHRAALFSCTIRCRPLAS